MKCVYCKTRTAKWQEKNDSKNVFCGRLCQIGLRGFGDDTIGLESVIDGFKVEITLNQARKMGTIRNYLEDEKGGNIDEYIPVNIDSFTLKTMHEFLVTERIEDLNWVTNDRFIKLLQAANYLDFEDFLYFLMPEWVNKRKLIKAGLPDIYRKDALYFSTDKPNLHGYLRAMQLAGPSWPVILAAENGRLFVLKTMIEKKNMNPRIADSFPLYVAITNGHYHVVEYLLENNLVKPAAAQNRAIRTAAKLNYIKIVKLLMKFESVDPSDQLNAALRSAAFNNNWEIANILLNDPRVGVHNTAERTRALAIAAEKNHGEFIRHLLNDNRYEVGLNDFNAFISAAEYDNVDAFRALLKTNQKLNPFQDFRALCNALSQAFDEDSAIMLRALISDDRFLFDIYGNVAFLEFVPEDRLDLIDILMQYGPLDFTINMNQPIREAASHGSLNVLRFFLEQDEVDPNAQDGEAFREAIQFGFSTIVKPLLASDRVVPELYTWSPLYMAADLGKYDIVSLILNDRRPISQNRLDDALRKAAERQNYNIVKLLVDDGRANPNVLSQFDDPQLGQYIVKKTRLRNKIQSF